MKREEKLKEKQGKSGIYTYVIYFVLTAIFFGWYYSDVMHIAQQYSFFTTNPEQMKFVTDNTPYGYLWLIGRALLQSYYFPILGGLITSVMLTLMAILISYIYKLKGYYTLFAYLVPTMWIGFAIYSGFDLYYQTETGKIFGIPFCILLILVLQALFISTFKKRKFFSAAYWNGRDSSSKQTYIKAIAIILSYACIITYNELERAYVRPTTYMQRCMWQQDWDAMISRAQECGVSCRPIAANYAIALSQKE